MRIADDAGEVGDVHKIAIEGDVAVEGVGKRLAGSHALAGESRIDELGEHVHAGTGPADGDATRHERVQTILDGGAFPEIDVIRLVAAGNPQGFRILNSGDNERIAGCGAVGNDEGGDRILIRAELLNIRIVGVGAGGADDEEIAIATATAHPLESGIDIGAAAHEDGAAGGCGGHVIRISHPKI